MSVLGLTWLLLCKIYWNQWLWEGRNVEAMRWWQCRWQWRNTLKWSRGRPGIGTGEREHAACNLQGNDPLGMSALLSVMPDPIGHPSLAEFLDELLLLRILLVIYPHHLLNCIGNPRACLRMTFGPPDAESLQLQMKFSGHPVRPSFHLLLFRLWNIIYRDLSLNDHRRILLFSEALKSSNCPMCKCVFVLICKCTNVFMCVCVYVLMNVCLPRPEIFLLQRHLPLQTQRILPEDEMSADYME